MKPIILLIYFVHELIILVEMKETYIETMSDINIEHFNLTNNRTISLDGSSIMLNGQPLQIISGSLHYFRVPAPYWRDRLRKLKFAGLNSVSTYVEWSYHEPEERQYNFEGDCDIAAFIKIAAEEGLYVLMRPGPYISAERDLGGFPYWILGKYPNIILRTNNEDFIRETKMWMNKLFEYLTPLLFGNGGPIIMVQVENEYGSYDNDILYKQQMSQIFLSHIGTNALLYTADGFMKSCFLRGSIPNSLVTINFGPEPSKVVRNFEELYNYNSSIPSMNSEYYAGWFSSWKEELHYDKAVIAIGSFYRNNFDYFMQTFKTMLYNKININIYVFCGGTNFEFTSGAIYNYNENVRKFNCSCSYQGSILHSQWQNHTLDPDDFYLPITTSYDYDAPISENGDPNFKYYALRKAIKDFKGENSSIGTPLISPKGGYGTVSLNFKVNLLSKEGRETLGVKYKEVKGSNLHTFEYLRQRGGLLLYETSLDSSNGLLEMKKPRDLIFVFVDGVLEGNISRVNEVYSIPIISNNNSVLSLLVENQGRVHFGWAMHEVKGVVCEVLYNNRVLNGTWNTTGYPLMNIKVKLESCDENQNQMQAPALFEGRFTINGTPYDTYLDPSGWEKGYAWINGHNLDRYWPTAGPQITLYVPGVWLRPAPEENLLQILELSRSSKQRSVRFIEYPIVTRKTA